MHSSSRKPLSPVSLLWRRSPYELPGGPSSGDSAAEARGRNAAGEETGAGILADSAGWTRGIAGRLPRQTEAGDSVLGELVRSVQGWSCPCCEAYIGRIARWPVASLRFWPSISTASDRRRSPTPIRKSCHSRCCWTASPDCGCYAVDSIPTLFVSTKAAKSCRPRWLNIQGRCSESSKSATASRAEEVFMDRAGC